MTAERVLGVDACKSGWIGIALTGGTTAAYAATHIDELVAAAHADGLMQVVAIDMPIGLPDAGYRRADQLARSKVGPQWRSVFMTSGPRRAGSPGPRERDRSQAGGDRRRVSAQAFALRHKLLEVDAWVRHTGARVVEVHPEVSFATLAGRPLHESKRTWAGAIRRRRLLTQAGIVLRRRRRHPRCRHRRHRRLDRPPRRPQPSPAHARPTRHLHRRHPQRHLDLTTKHHHRWWRPPDQLPRLRTARGMGG